MVKNPLLLFLKGAAMGAADVVPGVSGGTIAFITGIYDELLLSINKLGPSALRLLFRKGFLAFWHHINGSFLLTLGCGVLLSLFTLAKGISWLLTQPCHCGMVIFYGAGSCFGLAYASPITPN